MGSFTCILCQVRIDPWHNIYHRVFRIAFSRCAGKLDLRSKTPEYLSEHWSLEPRTFSSLVQDTHVNGPCRREHLIRETLRLKSWVSVTHLPVGRSQRQGYLGIACDIINQLMLSMALFWCLSGYGPGGWWVSPSVEGQTQQAIDTEPANPV